MTSLRPHFHYGADPSGEWKRRRAIYGVGWILSTVNSDSWRWSRVRIVDERPGPDDNHCGGTVVGEGHNNKVTYNYTPLFRGWGGRRHYGIRSKYWESSWQYKYMSDKRAMNSLKAGTVDRPIRDASGYRRQQRKAGRNDGKHGAVVLHWVGVRDMHKRGFALGVGCS